MRHQDRIARRDSFQRDAEAYAALRPEYPAETLAAAAELGALRRRARVLEVGCGTGQATAWLADLECSVVALDRAEEMLAEARRRLGTRPGIEFRQADFETLQPVPTHDALLFATSYHWLDPADRAARCAGHLVEGGALVLLWHTHPRPFTGFFERVQPIYERLAPGWEPPPSPGMTEDRVRPILDELVGSGLYTAPVRHSVDWSRTYSRADYLRLMSTYSDHILLREEVRHELFSEVAELVDAEFGGAVTRPYRTELVVARRDSGTRRG